MRRLNLVVVGRSGAGKSSFLNYAAGHHVFETGNGDPVTNCYFEHTDIKPEGKNVIYSLYDTKGLEAGNTAEWKNIIFNEIISRDQSDNIYDWFHTIIYCIDSSSKRIQPFEMDCIKELKKCSSVLVLLTKKDLVSQNELEGLKNQIIENLGNNLQILSVCSVNSRTRKGVSKQEGLDKVLRVSFLGLWDKMSKIVLYNLLANISRVSLTISDVPTINNSFYAFVILVLSEDASDFVTKFCSQKLIGQRMVIPSEFNEFAKKYHIEGELYPSTNKYYKFIIKGDALKYLKLPISVVVNKTIIKYGLSQYINYVSKIFISMLSNIEKGNIRRLYEASHKNIDEVSLFYNQVNGLHNGSMYFHETCEVIEKIEKLDIKGLQNEVREMSNKAISKLRELENISVFKSEETLIREAITTYLRYRDFVMLKTYRIWNLLNEFLNKYRSELHAYGQYCLREDEVANKSNSGYRLLRDLIKMVPNDEGISYKDLAILGRVALEYAIPPESLDSMIEEQKFQPKD